MSPPTATPQTWMPPSVPLAEPLTTAAGPPTRRSVPAVVAHFETAVDLIRRVGPGQNLRTLDALQLAAALDLNDPARPITLVCADGPLGAIAKAEGLAVINPEVP